MITQYLSPCLWNNANLLMTRTGERCWIQRPKVSLIRDLSPSLEPYGRGPPLPFLLHLSAQPNGTLDMPGLAQPWEWEGYWTSHWVLNEEIRQRLSLFRAGAPTIPLLSPSSYLPVCFHVESQGAYSRAEPLFHDMNIAAHLWFG